MTDALNESYAHCHAMTRRTAGNFFYSFLLLSRESAAPCAAYTRF